jgi:hypothetical protein
MRVIRVREGAHADAGSASVTYGHAMRVRPSDPRYEAFTLRVFEKITYFSYGHAMRANWA